ncbi:MAG TPA: TraB/GumN family protein [Salinivirgaceae bacterium]|nr:TraB/GumN family protein [Salinivirgaceae bacterium]
MTRIIIILNFFGFVFVLNSCKNAGTSKQTDKSNPNNSILWEISGNGLEHKSHLYGTIHIQDKRVFQYGKTVEDILKNTSIIAVEIELDKIEPMSAMQAMMMKDSTLDQLLSPDEYALLEEKYTEITGTSLATAQQMKPFFLSANIILSLIPKDFPVALDMHLIQYGRKENKRVVGLETFTEQMELIDMLSYSEQARMLLESLTDTIDIADILDNMLNAYLNMEADSLMVLIKDPSLPEQFAKAMISKRNHIMADRLEPLLKEGSVFCAVGAGHLFGEEGVIDLLKAKGYTLKPILFSFDNK